MKTIYLASNYGRRGELLDDAVPKLRAAGWTVVSRWVFGGHELGDDDFAEEALARFAAEDLEDIRAASHILCWPSKNSRGGHHIEVGYAMALGIPVSIIGERTNVFHYSASVRNFPDLDAWLADVPDELTRDPENPCDHWDKYKPGDSRGDCSGDGHYRCRECREWEGSDTDR